MNLIVLVEGKTEIIFVDVILSDHLRKVGYSSVSARLIDLNKSAGICSWGRAKTNIGIHLQKNAYVTTMVDYYELPPDWPGRDKSNALPTAERADFVESAILQDMRGEDAVENLIPYVMLHEFEAMLFSDCQKFADTIGYPKLKPDFQEIRDQFSTPEDIDDRDAPSKRIGDLLAPDVYRKPLVGVRGAMAIGLDAIRAECPHFARWMDKLEAIPRLTAR